jgi:hypothetical protein
MATPDEFRIIALAFPQVEEGSHMGHADFRTGGRIFASLGSPDDRWGMVSLLPEQQQDFIAAEPDAFKPAAGAWGRSGNTLVRLDSVSEAALRAALAAAWERRAPKR